MSQKKSKKNLFLDLESKALLEDAAKRSKQSESELVRQLIKDRFSNPLEAIRKEKRELGKRMNELVEREARIEAMMQAESEQKKIKSNWEISPRKRGEF